MGVSVPITVRSSGSWDKTERFLKRMASGDIFQVLRKYGNVGVVALKGATPVESGLTADSWDFEVGKTRGMYFISWTNTNSVSGVPVAILLQYGHGTGTGGYVQGRDFINPALKPIFDKIADDVWREVKSA